MLRNRLTRGLELIGDFSGGQLPLVHEAQDRDALRFTEGLEHLMNTLRILPIRLHARHCTRAAHAAKRDVNRSRFEMQGLRSLDLAQADTCAVDGFSVTSTLAPAATK